MKNTVFILLSLLVIACNDNNTQNETKSIGLNKIDIQAELDAIEKTRAAYEMAIKKKKFEGMRKLAMKDVKSLSPGCGPWEPFLNLRRNPTGEFSYDSLRMYPKETVIVSDSIAYDFGTSSTFYKNEEGEPIEITATYLAVLKKDKTDGNWKLYREVANTRELK